jgi:hypothetical protein
MVNFNRKKEDNQTWKESLQPRLKKNMFLQARVAVCSMAIASIKKHRVSKYKRKQVW